MYYVHPFRAISIGSVKIKTSLEMMKEWPCQLQWPFDNSYPVKITFFILIIRRTASCGRCHLQRCPWWGRQTASTLLARPTADLKKGRSVLFRLLTSSKNTPDMRKLWLHWQLYTQPRLVDQCRHFCQDWSQREIPGTSQSLSAWHREKGDMADECVLFLLLLTVWTFQWQNKFPRINQNY